MKRKLNCLMTALLALAGSAFLAPQVKAQQVHFQGQSYTTNDDLFLVVSDPAENGPKSYLVDLGSASQFIGLAAGTTLNLGNFNADLTSAFGAASGGGTWQTSQATWQIAGYNNGDPSSPQNTEFVTGNLANYLTTAGKSDAQNGFGSESTRIGGLASVPGTAFGTDGHSIFVNGSLSTDEGTLVDSAEASIGDNNNGSLLPSSLDLIELPTTGGFLAKLTGGANDLGTFTLDAAGDLTFTTAAAPEPTTWAMMLGGLGFLAWMLRRKQVLA